MLNSRTFYNSQPDGFAVLEVAEDNPAPNSPRRFAPLKRTDLAGTVTGPLATLTLTQTFQLADKSSAAIEARYRFPLPGDAAVLGVCVGFGGVEIHTTLKERDQAETDYQEAKRTGRQAALVTRESPDVFTLAIAGLHAGQEVVVQTEYVQLAKPDGAGWSLRVPLTTSPRYIRDDEVHSRHADGQPLAILRDPGHRFALDLTFSEADRIASTTHALSVEDGRVRLRDGAVLPDRDCVITWQPILGVRPAVQVWTYTDSAIDKTYFLALGTPPNVAAAKTVSREVILLVDHSGSMEGAKWEAADWAVERFLAGLSERDSFALGLFHNRTKWFTERPRSATPESVREAVAFLKANRDSGGTELGVALEQALDRPRSADTPSRHVLILTDAQVSDAGRILRLAEGEFAKSDRRRISVLCIDSAPNEALASQLAERGGGVSRFLTSHPDDDDVATALDDVLADWSAPVLSELTLEVNRAGAEAAGRIVALVVPGPASGIDIGDLPAGRPVWVVGRVPTGSEPLLFRLRTGDEDVVEYRVEGMNATPGLKALFCADRVRRLEYVMNADFRGEELRAELARLGYETPTASESKVYAENARDASAKIVRELLVRESLAAGVPCAETAFVAVRSEAGQVVAETQIIANALPHGWSEGFARGSATRLIGGIPFDAFYMNADAVELGDILDDDEGDMTTDFDPLERQRGITVSPSPAAATSHNFARASSAPPLGDIRISITAGQHGTADGAVLFDSPSHVTGQFTFLSVAFADKAITATALDSELTLLLFVGDLTVPRARVKLVDLVRQGGRRPLNIRRAAKQLVRLVLADPSGAWRSGIPSMEIVLGEKRG